MRRKVSGERQRAVRASRHADDRLGRHRGRPGGGRVRAAPLARDELRTRLHDARRVVPALLPEPRRAPGLARRCAPSDRRPVPGRQVRPGLLHVRRLSESSGRLDD